jgi:general stress protein 26
LEEMIKVLRSQDMCVLATVCDATPHCSLMAYITDEDCRKIYMITHKETKKYQNLLANPSVSLLIDTRLSEKNMVREKVQALNANGIFSQVENADKVELWRNRFTAAHPHLHDFAMHESAVLFVVHLKSLQLLNGATDASSVILDESFQLSAGC